MKALKRFFLLLTIALSSELAFALESSVQPIDSINQAIEDLRNADSQTLLVFDVDETLIYYPDAGLFFMYESKDVNDEENRSLLIKIRQQALDYIRKMDSEVASEFFNGFYLSKSIGQPVEELMVRLIHELQARHIKIIALTALPSGAVGPIPCGRTRRYGNLRKQGLDFSNSFKTKLLVFDELKKYKNDYPMFYKGILFANYRNDKGAVLGAFFDKIGWTPKRILFFDDNRRFVENVLQEMENRSIPCHGYWYQAAQHATKPTFNRAIALVQLDQLLNHNRLLTASEAKAIELQHHNEFAQP